MPADVCITPFGEFALERIPPDRTGTLRAWDGADLLLLDAVSTLADVASRRVLIVGDNFGALSVALHGPNTWILSESIVAEHAIERNLRHCIKSSLSHGSKLLSSTLSTGDLTHALGGPVDTVVWNIGRSTDLLTYLGDLVLSVSHPATVVFAAGMDKHLPPTTGDELRKHGAVTTHPGRKKAHLFELHPSGANPTTVSQPPGPLLRSVRIDEHQLDVDAWPGVFSSEQFDLGTRLLADLAADLDNILPEAEQVVDLGCGTGVLGMLALRSLPRATVSFIDESAHAIESARHNVLTNLGSLGPTPEARSHFIRSHIFDDARLPEIDVILCNPPFHHTNAMNDAIAWQMFVQSSKVLRPGGELWVVANRHLGYHEKLTRIFDATAQMVSHPKFVVIAARR